MIAALIRRALSAGAVQAQGSSSRTVVIMRLLLWRVCLVGGRGEPAEVDGDGAGDEEEADVLGHYTSSRVGKGPTQVGQATGQGRPQRANMAPSLRRSAA